MRNIKQRLENIWTVFPSLQEWQRLFQTGVGQDVMLVIAADGIDMAVRQKDIGLAAMCEASLDIQSDHGAGYTRI